MDKRTQKQLIIGLTFILVVGGISYGLVDYFFITETTCFDRIQNGKEEGVDCGLLACGVACEPAIEPLDVKFQKLLQVREGDYDFLAQVNNPNSFFGASRARYDLNLVKKDGTLLNTSGSFYIFPGQTRYLIIPNIRSDGELTTATLGITGVEWEKIQPFGNISFPIQRKNYTVINRNGIFSELEAVVLNDSDFDFDKVEVGIILWDNSNNVTAVNKTDMRTFLSRTERYFKVSWPTELPETMKQDVEVLTNIFENSNFIKKYGTQEKFQKYY